MSHGPLWGCFLGYGIGWHLLGVAMYQTEPIWWLAILGLASCLVSALAAYKHMEKVK
jgi:hypothetical protein